MTSEAEQGTPDAETTDTATKPAQETTAAASISPGELLHRAREAKGLSISELVTKTRLARATLEALEKNDFGTSKPVFVRGYFRKCAGVLDISEEELINAYAAWTGTSLTPQPLAPTFVEPPADYDEARRIPGLKYIIGAGVLLGMAMWWFGSSGHRAPAVPAAGSSPTPSSSSSESTDDGQSRTLTLQPPPTPNPTAPTASVDVSPSSNPAPTSTQASSDQSNVTTQTAITPESLQIRVERVASWVEISDNDGKRLVYDLMQPGAERQVNGKPPYQVTIGNPGGVYLAMGGKQVDLGPYTSPTGTARLTLNRPD